MFSKQNSMGLYGVQAYMVEVEVDVSKGLSAFDIVGLPDNAIKESRDRVRAAMKNAGFPFPDSRITVNLSPADVRKEGTFYDLPILITLLSATEQLKAELKDAAFLGELSLDGGLRPVRGVLAMAIAAKENGIRRLFLPADNAAEGAVVEGLTVYAVRHIKQLIAHLKRIEPMPVYKKEAVSAVAEQEAVDFSDVKGQMLPKRALEIAAAGGHNVLFIGPPGAGKSMLAKRFSTILPEMTQRESIETTKIYSVAGLLQNKGALIRQRPFRAPHHTVSTVGLTGGGRIPGPGEISLAHNGVLFLDELPEFGRSAMEALRQPLEDGAVTISRAAGTLTYPCSFILIAAMNPCPCGYFGHPTKACTCSQQAVRQYLNKISGPMLDRLDLHVEVPPVDFASLYSRQKQESSAEIRRRVNRAREIQRERYASLGFNSNAQLPAALLNTYCDMTQDAAEILKQAFDRMGMSGRAYDRLLKVSRTLADLDAAEKIDVIHVAQAVQLRSLDRKYWMGQAEKT